MTDHIRKKLVELINEGIDMRVPSLTLGERLADHLIANNVTVQEWIPVSERLPEDGDVVIIWVTSYMELGWYDADVAAWKSEYVNDYEGDVTHWMPLPQPPKGE